MIVAPSPACTAVGGACALGLHQDPGHHISCLNATYLNYRWSHLKRLKDNDGCHKDKEYESLRERYDALGP